MIELIFVACLTAAPATCERRAIQYVDITVASCNMGAQPELAVWVNQHPGWRIQRWACQRLEPGQAI